MAETENGRVNPFQRHLLEGYMQGNQFSIKLEEVEGRGEDSEQLELSLGLSLNGRFGVDPKANKLKRSSSISDFLNPVRDVVGSTHAVVPVIPCMPLTRTCSLPIETEEEWRKRKELQMLRRMEIKRKRLEKQRILRAGAARDRSFGEENCEASNVVDQKIHTYKQNLCRKSLMDVPGPVGLVPTNGVKLGFLDHGAEAKGKMGNGLVGGGGGGCVGGQGFSPPPPLMQQGSVGSQRSGSSRISESESQMLQETTNRAEANRPSSVQSLPVVNDQKLVVPIERSRSGKVRMDEVMMGSNGAKLGLSSNGTSEIVKNVLSDMPCVTTKGDGPDGKVIQGFLYSYRKGEEARIVCVCHGSSLTPSEFVKHAGGGEVENPLRHIVVNPSPFL